MSQAQSNTAARAPALKPTELMKACGSKSGQWKPESPEHWRWILANGEGAERALAWVKLASVGRGSPVCVDAAGERLRVAHLAADCGWAQHTAENYCDELAREGRIRLQKGKGIWYRADVPQNGRQGDESISSVQRRWPTYLLDFIRTLPKPLAAFIEALPEERLATVTKYAAWRKRLFADGMAALRVIDEQVQDTTLLAVGCKKKRLPKRDRVSPEFVQLSLLETPEFLSSVQSDVVQGSATTSYKAESASVPGRASLLTSETSREVIQTSSSSAPLRAHATPETMMLTASLPLSEADAQTLLDRCREVTPSLTAREVKHLAAKCLLDSPRAHSPVGLLLTRLHQRAVGTMLETARKDAAREIETEIREAQATLALTEAEAAEIGPGVHERAYETIERLKAELAGGHKSKSAGGGR